MEGTCQVPSKHCLPLFVWDSEEIGQPGVYVRDPKK